MAHGYVATGNAVGKFSRRARAAFWPVAGLLLVVAMALPAWADRNEDEKNRALDQRIATLIEQLGNDKYAVRQRAQEDLLALGAEAFDAITLAQQSSDVEVAMRARFLVRSIRIQWVRTTDAPAIREILKDYEPSNEAGRLRKVEMLAKLPARAGAEALCRLVRFDPSGRVSKWAAVQVISQSPSPPDERSKRAEAMLARVRRSGRPAADWLRAFAAAEKDSKNSLDPWQAIVKQEQATLASSPRQTSRSIVQALLLRQVVLLDRLERTGEVNSVMDAIIDLQTGETNQLQGLIGWLVERQAWSAIEKTAEKFADSFERDPNLLYSLAEAYKTQGKDPKADQAAERAALLWPTDQERHLEIARYLWKRGHLAWSEREFRHVIKIGKELTGDGITMNAQFQFASMLHDQGRDLQAAQVLEDAVARLEKEAEERKAVGGSPETLTMIDDYVKRISGEMSVRMHYSYSCHYLAQDDRAQQIEHLKKAVQFDRTDADVLIALYRLPDPDPELRRQTRTNIKEVSKTFYDMIGTDPDREAVHCNQYAWLVGSTFGDYDEAVKQSHRSLELSPETAGYYDTLGRCYYGQGDLANAIKYQREAVRLDPHSGLIQKQRELFDREAATDPEGAAQE